MRYHRTSLRVLLLGALHVAGARADAAELCKGLEPKDTDDRLALANKAQTRAQEALDDADRKLALARKAQEAAVAKLTEKTTSSEAKTAVTQTAETLAAAAVDHEAARHSLEEATKDAACVQAKHDAARRFVHSLGVAASGAYAADRTERLGFSLRYVHPSDQELTWELLLGLSHFRLSNPDDERDTLVNLLYRWSFGRDRAAFFLGGGLAWLPQGAGDITAPRSYAMLGEIGVVFRMNHKCSPTGACVTPWVDLRPFAQPWLPLDGSPAALLFGIELGASIGFTRSSVE